MGATTNNEWEYVDIVGDLRVYVRKWGEKNWGYLIENDHTSISWDGFEYRETAIEKGKKKAEEENKKVWI